MSKKMLYTLFSVFMLAAMVLTACGGGGDAASADPIIVGGVHDLTGATADVGTPYAEGIKGYVAWRNANGGIAGRQIELISADYAYKVDQAELLYTQYIGEGAVVFQGWGTGDTEALRTKVAADEVPFMSASYSAALLDMNEAPYNFLVGTTYSDQAIIAVRWAMDDWAEKGNSGMPAVAITHHDSPFGQSPVEDAKAYAEAHGVSFMSLPMPGGVTDYVAELAQMQQFGANYIIIHTVSSPAAVMIKDAVSQGSDVQFICLNWCADEGMVELAGDAAEGVMGAIPFTPTSSPVPGHEDAAAWLKENGQDLNEIGLHYTQGWWTMATMARGIEIVLENGDELTGANIKAALETLKDFDTGGVTAPITFTSTSHRGNNALRLYTVKDGKWVSVSDFISAE